METRVHGAVHDAARLAEVVGKAPLRPRVIVRGRELAESCSTTVEPAGGFNWGILPIAMDVGYRSAYAGGGNDGPLWQSRGLSGSLTGGGAASWGPLSAAVAPYVTYYENADFPIVDSVRIPEPYSQWVYPWAQMRIDWPQRFGDSDDAAIHPGDSYLRVDAFGAALGISTENLWWGPGRRHSPLMTNTAAGFPHVFLGTSGVRLTRIGGLQAELLWGRLGESEYFDSVAANDHRLFTAVVAAYGPRWVPGLYVGFARVYQQTIPPGGLELGDYFPFLEPILKEGLASPDNPWGADVRDQLASVFLRWSMPSARFEIYGEYARNDHNWDLHDFAVEPEHSRGYVLGAQKAFLHDDRWIRSWVEIINLEATRTGLHRSAGPFYQHFPIRQGYTHQGQLLGSSIGPGSSAQGIGVDVFDRRGVAGLYFERIRYNADHYFRSDIRGLWPWRHDVELTIGGHAMVDFGSWSLRPSIDYTHRKFRNYAADAHNVALRAQVIWRPGRRVEASAAAVAP